MLINEFDLNETLVTEFNQNLFCSTYTLRTFGSWFELQHSSILVYASSRVGFKVQHAAVPPSPFHMRQFCCR